MLSPERTVTQVSCQSAQALPMAKREPPVRLPADFEATVRALLKTPPPPAGDPSTRKQKPKKKKAAPRKRKRP
jgi:hypothetical protein